MDQPEIYSPNTVLNAVSERLHDSCNLRVTLSTTHPTCEEALQATARCVHGNLSRIALPTTNPAIRERLRAMALENVQKSNENIRPSNPRPIRTSAKLNSNDLPTLPSPEERAMLKKFLLKENRKISPPRQPYVVNLHALSVEDDLASLIGNVTLSAIDHEDGMPYFSLADAEILWDTGAHATFIAKDILSEDFQQHLADPVHDCYRCETTTRIQISFRLEFTNTIFELNTVAFVVDKETVPNMPSGIILGQRGCINRMQYRSIPRLLVEAQGGTIDPKFWGDIVIEGYVDLSDSLHIC